MQHYGLRLTVDSISDLDVRSSTGGALGYFKERGLTFAVRELGENQDNPHYHLLFAVTDERKLNALKQYVKTKYPGGNEIKAWTRSIKDVSAHLRYLCKGVSRAEMPHVVYNEGHDVVSYHNLFWDVNDELHAKKIKKRPLDQCYEDINVQDFELSHEIGKRILLWHVNKRLKPPSKFDMPKIILLYQCRHSQDNGNLENDLDMLYNSFYL